MNALSRILGLSGAALLLVAAPTMAVAQATAGDPDAREARELRADELIEEAGRYADRPSRWDYASSLYRKSASLREEGDARAIEAMVMAANLAYYGGFETQAIVDLERAAERALRGGDVVTAAHKFVDAAWVAQKLHDGGKAREFVSRSVALSDSPLLTPADRAAIAMRIGEGGTVFASLIDPRGRH